MNRLYIAVARNPENAYTLLHKPIIALGRSGIRQCECPTDELLEAIRSAGATAEEISRAQSEIEENGQTVLESATILDKDLENAVHRCCDREPS